MSARLALIAAGGTGGHLFPAAAFCTEMQSRGWRIVLMTDARGRKYAQNFPADSIEDVPAATVQTLNPFAAANAALKIWRGIDAAQKRLRTLKPAMIAGFGGYPSLPALWAARAQKRPILIHEQNSVLGRVNRAFAKDAAAVACGFDRLERLPPGAAARKYVTGNPVRPAILALRDAPYPMPSAGGPLHLLIIGGSQGARVFGDVIPEALVTLPDGLRARLRVAQQVREEQCADVRALYAEAGVQADVQPFFTDMPARLGAAHLVIARAGASTVTELQAVGRPAILVPLKIAADDHQSVNAQSLAEVGAADIIAEDDFTPEQLSSVLQMRASDLHGLSVRAQAARAAGKPDAARALADLAEQIAAG
ncbi:MAG: undecaprenyldiphospho-muramoylpentapeptide beta-N-acetylglucosaminyltransferase [Alphaproteobacteria bacterium]|nr:undecaprenyldiphospho-muramoylpentapeptide beta-N-acetylglucosaminyltransferase [Alphaproteobacteria bacterium]